MIESLRVALVHDWLTGMRGGEKVLEVFADIFPNAPIYTLLHKPGSISAKLANHPIHTSPLQRLPMAQSKYRYYLPLMPMLIESLDIEPVDLVLSSSSCVAKGVRKPKDAKHASYLHSPMRYIYDRYDDYFAPGKASLSTRIAMRLARRPLQRWDIRNTDRIDALAANSGFVQQRIESIYRRQSDVIHPPVDVERFASVHAEVDDYYLMVTALVPYKNVDVAIDAFRTLDRRLIIAGSGPLYDRLAADCPPNVVLRGWVDDAEIPALVAGCRAFLFPCVEDFGIAPVEAMAAGRPVIALGAGGALDTVRDIDDVVSDQLAPTGVLYAGGSPADLAAAIRRFESVETQFNSAAIRKWAKWFDRSRFETEIRSWLDRLMSERVSRRLAA